MRSVWVMVSKAAAAVAGAIYYSPGRPGTGTYELWSSDGLTSSLVWTSAAWEGIYCLFYSELGGSGLMYMITWDYLDVQRLYSWTVGGTPSLVGSMGVNPRQPVQACEFGGSMYLYLADSGWGDGYAWCATLDLATAAVTMRFAMLVESSSTNFYGGIASDGTYLYVSDGGYVHRSEDGSAWTQIFGWDGDYYPWLATFTSSESQGKVYCTCNNSASGGIGITGGVYEVTPSGISLVAARPSYTYQYGGLVHIANGATQTGPLAVSRNGSGGALYYHIGPTYAATLVGLAGATRAWLPKMLTSTGGDVYGLFQAGSDVLLAKYDGASWGVLETHASMDGNGLTTMTVATSSLKCHEV